MSYIIRDRFWTGKDVIDGNNPFTIQGHQVSNYLQSERGQIKDYLDLTDNLASIPREIAYRRSSHPLLGGFNTVKNYTGPMQDYLALQYARPKPAGGYIGPKNRHPETPDITIGKAGTFDIKFKKGSILKYDTLENIQGGLKDNIEVIYNYGDFDDSYAPVAETIPLGTGETTATYFDIKLFEEGYPGKYGRCVGTIELKEEGKTLVNKLIAVKRELNKLKYNGLLHISDIRQTVTWFELMLVADEFTNTEVKVLNALQDTTNKDTYLFVQPQNIHAAMDIPIERINISVPINNGEEDLIYTSVPVWDYKARTNSFEGTNKLQSIITFVANGKDIIVKIQTKPEKTKVIKEQIRFMRSFPLMPVTCQYNHDSGALSLSPHPMINPAVIKPVRTEAFLVNGMHFECMGTETYTSKWGGYSKPKTPDKSPNGMWMPGAYATHTINIATTGETKSTTVEMQGIPPIDMASNLEFITKDLPVGYLNEPYLALIEVAMKKAPFKECTADGNLPTGLIIDKATGVISGKPTVVCAPVKVTFTATDGSGAQTQEITMAVYGGKPEITNTKLNDITQDTDYDDQIVVKGGYPSYSYKILEGASDSGIVLDPNTGKITGKSPTKDVSYTIKFEVTDGKGEKKTKDLTLKVGGNALMSNDAYLKSITAKMLKSSCKGPEDLEVTGTFDDKTTRVLGVDEYTISGPKLNGDLTITSKSNPSISCIAKKRK